MGIQEEHVAGLDTGALDVDDQMPPDLLPAPTQRPTSLPLDYAVMQHLAAGAAPGAVIEQAAVAIRVLCPDRGVAVWLRHEDGTTHVQAAGIGAHLVMIAGDPDSPFWTRARNEDIPNYRITVQAQPDDLEPTSVWCIPTSEGPVAGDVTVLVVGSGAAEEPDEDVRAGIEHLTRLIGMSVDRKHLVDRLERAHDRSDGPSPTIDAGIVPTRGDADELAETALLYVSLAEIHDIEHIHGHKAAEELLTEVGRRLSRTVRPGDTIGRLNSTTFAIRCYQVNAVQAESIVVRVLHGLWEPVITRWEETRLRPRIGMTRIGRATPLSQMLRDAERGMRNADQIGRDWLWDTDEIDPTPPALGPAPDSNGFGAGRQGPAADADDDQSEPGRLEDSTSGSPE